TGSLLWLVLSGRSQHDGESRRAGFAETPHHFAVGGVEEHGLASVGKTEIAGEFEAALERSGLRTALVRGGGVRSDPGVPESLATLLLDADEFPGERIEDDDAPGRGFEEASGTGASVRFTCGGFGQLRRPEDGPVGDG